MRAKFLCILLLLIFKINASANSSVAYLLDNTDWRGNNCSSYGDGIFQGTYNYIFKENNRVESYLEYYEDRQCTKLSGKTDAQIIGNYTVKFFKKEGDKYFISLSVKLNHLREAVTFNIRLAENNMKLCWDYRWCSDLIKK